MQQRVPRFSRRPLTTPSVCPICTKFSAHPPFTITDGEDKQEFFNCSECGFAWPRDRFSEIPSQVRNFVENDLPKVLPKINGTSLTGKFILAALCEAAAHEPMSAVGQMMLIVAECMLAEGKHELSRKYRAEGVGLIVKGMLTHQISPEFKPDFSLLISAEYQKLGRTRLADFWQKTAYLPLGSTPFH